MRDECNIGCMSDADRYRLAPLRDMRARDEAASRGVLAGAIDDARVRERVVAAAAARIDEWRTRLDRAVAAPVASAQAATWRDRHAARLRGELDRAIAEHARRLAVHRDQLTAVDEARQQLALARGRREVVERHFARWREARRKLIDRRED
jgi:hypothetical protein